MKLAVILGTIRKSRLSPREATWVVNSAHNREDIEVELIDLVDYPLPYFDEPISPRYNPNREIPGAVAKWLEKIAPFDAYIFVTPEYNHSIPSVLKNAIDYLTWELQRKPVAVVSHGSAGGARATLHLKDILSESRAAVIPNGIALTGMSDMIDESGNLSEAAKAMPFGPQTQLEALLDELKWYSDALAAARNKQ